jgi:hypothetical protein
MHIPQAMYSEAVACMRHNMCDAVSSAQRMPLLLVVRRSKVDSLYLSVIS